MTLLTALRRTFRRTKAADVTPGVDGSSNTASGELNTEMSALADKLAAKRGDNITMGVALGEDDFGGRLAENADMAGIVDHRDEDTLITG